MIARRRLLQLLPGLALLSALPAFAQRRDRPARIATLDDGHEATRAPQWAAFRKRLRELGHTEGKSVLIETRWARGEPGRLPGLAAELVTLQPDIIVTSTTSAALAAKRATSLIPIVAAAVADPIKAGLAATLGRPGGKLTGTSVPTTELAGKWLELMSEVAPAARSLAFLTDTSNPGSMLVFRELADRAQPLGVKVQALGGRTADEAARSLKLIASERMDGFIVSSTGLLLAHRQQIIDAAARQRIPVIYARREYVDAGGLMSYGTDIIPMFLRAADLVHAILQGAKPSDMPVEQAATFKLVLNLKTARALGLTIPPALAVRVDEAIE